MTTRSSEASAGLSISLKTSRMRRLALFRRTASPSFREATMPSRGPDAGPGAKSRVKYLDDRREPVSNTRLNSPRRRTRSAFVKLCDGKIPCYDDETVSRLRPLARRRFSTRRPFLVAIRVRNPCVFARWRRFGWKVRFMMSGSPNPSVLLRRNLDTTGPRAVLSIRRGVLQSLSLRPQ
jgi:hypothetical protein